MASADLDAAAERVLKSFPYVLDKNYDPELDAGWTYRMWSDGLMEMWYRGYMYSSKDTTDKNISLPVPDGVAVTKILNSQLTVNDRANGYTVCDITYIFGGEGEEDITDIWLYCNRDSLPENWKDIVLEPEINLHIVATYVR